MTVLHANCCEVCGFVHRHRVNVAHFRTGTGGRRQPTRLCPNRVLTPAIVIPETQILRDDRTTITVRKRSL